MRLAGYERESGDGCEGKPGRAAEADMAFHGIPLPAKYARNTILYSVHSVSAMWRIEGKAWRKGLGLPIARSLARLHGGDLSIDSTPGKGTTIAAHFPASRAVRNMA